MSHWLIKSEPSKYSWDKFVEDGQTHWDGIRNYTARNNLKAMKKGDEIFFYHSNEGLEIVGIARVVEEAYQDPTTDDTNWVVVDIVPDCKMKKPVTLAAIKANKNLEGIALVKLGRLSVCPIKDEEWDIILGMGEMK